jgi:hypothetical protein
LNAVEIEMHKEESLKLKNYEKRLLKLEKHAFEEFLFLVEFASTINFFGGLKTKSCQYAKNGQCNLFILKDASKDKMPLSTECRISKCKEELNHFHLELSEMTCIFCNEYISK